jgi:hypothetical protein
MDIRYFAEETVSGLKDVCHPEERNLHERKMALHFDNPPIHNTRTAMGQLRQRGFKRMEHPADGPDLAPYGFFLVRRMKEQLKGRNFADEEELLSVLSGLTSEIPLDMILQVVADWNRRPRRCLLIQGEHVELSFIML